MRHLWLILILSAGVIAIAIALIAPHHTRRHVDDDFRTPLPGRAPVVSAAELVAAPISFHRRRIVLHGVWRRAFELSRLEVVEGDSFDIWLDIWDSNEFATESKKFFDPVLPSLTLDSDSRFRLRAEGSFYYRPRSAGGGFGHLGSNEALFVIDRVLDLALIPENEPNPESSASAQPAQPEAGRLLNKP